MDLRGTICFASGRTCDFDIWTLNLQTGTLRQLTYGQQMNDFPRFSPDGSQIAYISTGASMIASLSVMDSNGQNKRQLVTDAHCQYPSWSPDGKKILFTANAEKGDELDIFTYDLESDTYQVLFRRAGEETEPSFSPDGRKVVFSAVNPNSTSPFPQRDSEIWERDIDTGSERKICSHPARDFCPVFSPDGKQIAFVSHRNGREEEEYLEVLQGIKNNLNVRDRKSIDEAIRSLQACDMDSEICVVNSDGSNLRELTSNNGHDIGVRWSPCGNFLIYSAGSSGSNADRLKVVEVNSGEITTLQYDRGPLLQEIGADPNQFLNNDLVMKILPDFLERPLKKFMFGQSFWGEEHQPDWTYADI